MVFIAELRLAEYGDIVLVLAGTRVGDMDIGSCQRTIQLEGDVRINDGGGGNSIIHDDRIYPDSCPCQKRPSVVRQRKDQHRARIDLRYFDPEPHLPASAFLTAHCAPGQ